MDGGTIVPPSIATAQRPPPATRRPDITIRLGRTRAGSRVDTLRLEDYVAQVLAGEGQPRAADAAQQAVAIAARTFALANRNRHRRQGYDLCDTTHCQVLRPSTETTRRAADATAGRVLVHQGQPASVFYSAWCGGRTEIASQVWPGAIDYAFEPSQEDDACEDEPEWVSEIARHDVERALRAAGLRGQRLRDLKVVQRNASGRVTRLRAEGFTPPEVSGHDFRMAVTRFGGPHKLRSTAFEVDRDSDTYRFEGRGFGHGVGLCVVGAGRRAERGANVDDILRFYFPGLRVEQYSAASLTTKAAPPAAREPAAPTVTAGGVVVTAPGAEAPERAALVDLVRRARDEIAAQAGVRAPAAIPVIVHPTLEAFARATGQPWWVPSSTDGKQIELAPLATLRQLGQFDRAIRHEVAHVLLDPVLARRPLWVREGAAHYFSSPDTAPPATRVECPADAEFERPVSAGTHRDAHARAEACFRRAIAQGRSWRDVR